MTDRELMQQALEALEIESKGYADKVTRNRAIIAALHDRLAQPEQEPVVYLDEDLGAFYWPREYKKDVGFTPLYTTPPRREWVGLTEDEIDECYYWKDRQWTTDELVRHVEAKLKEKNSGRSCFGASVSLSQERTVAMTPKQEAALRQAREALKESHPEAYRHTIAAIDEALAEQPVQPCGYPYCGCNSKAWCKVEQQSGIKQVIELYDSPEQPAPVAKPHEQQEPVAWMWRDGTVTSDPDRADGTWTPLYTTPPRREWVGLTAQEAAACWSTSATKTWQAIEAKLKEKNA